MNQLFEIIANLISTSSISFHFFKTFLFSIGIFAIYQMLKMIVDNFPTNYLLDLSKA